MMPASSSIEQAHCRELAMPAGSLFEFTSRFVPAGRLESLTAVYALVHVVGSIPLSSVEDPLKWAQLKWWSEELAADPDSPSRHPVLRALNSSGARKLIDSSLTQRLVNSAATQIDDTPDCDQAAMFERFANQGASGILMELALESVEINNVNLRYLAAASGLHAFVSRFSGDHRPAAQRLPLDVLARFKASTADLQQQSAPAELARIVGYLAARAEEWFAAGLSGLRVCAVPDSGAAGTHLQLRWAVEKRRLVRIGNDAGGFLGAGERYGPSYAWFAWRFLRRLNRLATTP